MKKSKFFNLAKKVSYKSPSRFKLGCVIVNKKRVINFGWNNMNKTHPRCKTYDSYLHAEIHSLINTTHDESRGADAYIYRETRLGTLANARPCTVCLNELRIAGIRTIHYTIIGGFRSENL